MNRASLWLGCLAMVAVGVGLFAWRTVRSNADELARPDPPAARATNSAGEIEASLAAASVRTDPVRRSATPDQHSSLADHMAAFPQGFMGLVVDRNGRPMVGVKVYLIDSPRNEPLSLPVLRQQGLLMGPVMDTSSRADGTFALGLGLAQDKLYELCLVASGHADLRIGDLRVLPDEWHDIGRVAMVTGTTVRGRVTVEGTTTPISQAIITVEARTVFEDAVLQGIHGRERGLHAIAGIDGSYVIKNAPARGVVRISAAASGFARVIKQDIDLSKSQMIEAHFALPAGLTITGLITDSQRRPIARARVEAWSSVTSLPPSIDHSRTNGSFEIVGLRPGVHRLRILAQGYQDLTLEEVDAGRHEVAIELRRRATITIHVTGRGRTLRNYDLGVRRFFPAAPGREAQIGRVRELLDQTVHLSGMTDRFTVEGMPTGQFVVQVAAGGYAKTLSPAFSIEPETGNLGVAVQMTPGGTLRGRIVDENNAPLGGATITTQPNGARPDNPVWRMLAKAAPDRITALSVQSGPDGSFVLPQLAYANYQLEVRHREACRSLIYDLTVSGPDDRDLGTIRLVEGTVVFGRATIGGRVTGQIKIVVSSVIAADASPETAAAAIRVETVTNNAGKFVLPRRIPPGTYKVRAAAVNVGDPDAQVFQHLMQMQRSATTFTIAHGQRHFEKHIDIPTDQ